MTQTQPPQDYVSPTAIPSADQFGLGKTPGQRGAEILAGFRAEKLPSPETLALSRWSGRIVARLLIRLAASEGAINYVASRPSIMEGLMRRSLPTTSQSVTIVDLAAGLSPRGLQMAAAMPQARVIEIDLPGVIQDKKERLAKAAGVIVPPNLEMRIADLGTARLADVLDGHQVDVIAAEGLIGYFSFEEVDHMLRRIHESLKPGGVFVTDVAWQAGLDAVKQVASFFSRQAGTFKTVTKNEAEARALFEKAGYAAAEVYHASQLVADFKLPTPMMDIAFFAVARK